MPNTLWQLRGTTERVIECRVDRTPSKSHLLTVILGRETCLNETYPDESSARIRALQVRDGLLKSGAWIAVGHPAVGLSPT
jgi:hypothetical protein